MAFAGGAFNELDFLTNIPILDNDDNRDTIFNEIRGEVGSDGYVSDPNKTVIFKKDQPTNTTKIKNYYKENLNGYKDPNSDLNPYLRLIRDFEGDTFKAVSLQAGDFAYLTKLGVYPINRMWILRRFSDSATVPDNLTDWGDTVPYARETMIGWIEPEDDTFFKIGFNEEWTTITERMDEVLMKIIEKEFGLKIGNAISLPGWSQGLLMGFLNKMGLTNYDIDKVPMGDPAVLQEAAARAKDSSVGYGNKSTMSMTLKTSYEQKFIGDVDPGNAMLDIISRAVYMGTRNTKFVFSGGGSNTILSSLRKAADSGGVEDWWTFISNVIDAFLLALGDVIDGVKDAFESDFKTQPKETEGNQPPAAESKAIESTAKVNKFRNVANNPFLKGILASTVGKWRYALIGSIALMDGSNSTPWHLTLGNPYSPFVSLGNIVVKSVNLNFNNEFGFNDIPTRLDVEIQITLGRNLGAQEILKMFNNGYMRVYKGSGGTGSAGNKNPTTETKTESTAKTETTKTNDASGNKVSTTNYKYL